MRRRHAGMTLVELLIACVILALIMVGMSRALMSAYESQAAIDAQNAMQQSAQMASDAVMDDLRGSLGLTAGAPTEVRAELLNGDVVRYYLEGAELKCDSTRRGRVTVGEVICRDVSELTFAYLRWQSDQPAGGTELEVAPTAAVASVLQLTVTVATGRNRATETSAVTLRNRPV